MELSLQEDIVENNDEIKVEGEILTWDTLWFEVCSSGEQNEDNKETVKTCSETAISNQVICSTEIKNDEASDSTLNIGSKGNDVSAVTTKSASSQKPEHANNDAVAEVKGRTSTIRDGSTASSLITKALATNQDTSSRTSKENDYTENQTNSRKKKNDDTCASVLNKNGDQNIRSKDNVCAVITKSVSSEKPEHAIYETTAEVKRRTNSVRDKAKGSQLLNKSCATYQDALGRTSKENDETENQIISSKKGKGNKRVNILNKKAQFKTSGVRIKYKQNVNKNDIKLTRKSERGNVEKMFNSTEWDTSTSRVKKKTQTSEKLTMITESKDLEERTKENERDTTQNLPCNELSDSQTGITENTVYDLLGEIEINIPYQLNEDQFNNFNSITINNNESGQSDDNVDSENCTLSVIDTESNCQQRETSCNINDGRCQFGTSEYVRKDNAKTISLNPQIKKCNVLRKDIQNGRTDSEKIIIENPQNKEYNVILKDTQYGRTDTAKTINLNPHIKECYVVLKDIGKENELTENTANNQSSVSTNRRVVTACNDFNGDEESLNSLRANYKEAKYNKVSKVMKSFHSRTEVNNQKQKGNICKWQQLNKLGNQKFHFPCRKEFKYSCDVCYKRFTKSQHLRKHTKTHEIPKTQRPKTRHWCFPCGKEFESKSSLKKHQIKHTDERPYTCNVCCKSFKCSRSLKRHALIHSSNRTKVQKQKTTHWCFPCGKEYKRMSRLKEHQKIHTEEMPYSCNVCCKTFKKLDYLKSHTRIHTSVRSNLQKQKTTHWCFPCGKEFKRMCRLREHQKSHSDERPYSCCLCSRKFKKLYYLKLHRRIHTGETPYKCEFCDKKFRYGSSLWLHKEIHKDITERKTFLCTFCGKSCFQKSNFEIHLLSHQTERRQSGKECQDSGKNVDAIRMNDQSIDSQSEFSDKNVLNENFKCLECDAMFEDKDTLKLHEETHVNFKTFNCDECAEEFNFEKHLIKHLYIHMRENNHNQAFKRDNQKKNIRNREKELSRSGIGMLKTTVTSDKEYPSKSHSHRWKFKCYQCTAGFNRMSKLKIHESSHAGLKIQHCDLCGQGFRNKSSLKHHNQIHTGENYFNCDQCDSSFKERSKLEAHKQKDHTGEKPFRCSVCFKRFREKSSLNKHIKHVCSQTKVSNSMRCNEEIQYESKNSREQLPVSTSLWLNKEAMSKKKERFVCLHCGKGFHYMARYKIHLLTHSDVKPFSCDVCGKSFRRGHSLKTHRRIHTGEKPYVCSFCEKAFNSLTSLIFHRRTHTGEKPYLCHVCGLQFSTGSCLNIHLSLHQDIKLHKCQICHKAYKRLRHLKKHIETHQERDKLKCETCSKEFFKDTLKSHMKIHTGIKPFSCLMCKKTFVSNQDLNQHKRSHTGEKPFKCDLCNKKFSVQKSLIDHLRVHSGEKPYACDICGKCFSQTGSRRTHLKTHSLSKEYVCEQCGKEFTFKCNYEKHMITHTSERPFTCKVCNKGFTQSSSLNTHYRLHKKELNSRKHKEKDLILNESRSAESDKAQSVHEKVKVVNQTSMNLKNTGTPSMMDGRMMSTQKDVTDEKAAPKTSKIKKTQKQITKFKAPKYTCSNCGKMFNQKCSLNVHQQMHYEKKQFKCDVCGKEFNFKGNLKTHLRVHTNEKPYKCHECGKGFSQSSSLHTHSRLHDK
ncbi:zinc finger protein 721-like [Mytilus edulis]|uniref:zinc finger protein 721-like n=1 Tax=Mytilus edulis TaxID=6550 RepID=UPI0039EE886C